MRSVSRHQQAVEAVISGIADNLAAVPLPLADALDRVTASTILAPRSLPEFDNSAMDGYAVIAADLAGASEANPVRLPVTADIPAGRTDRFTLQPGTAARIMTGAALPDGADAVVPVERTGTGHFVPGPSVEATVEFPAPIETGRNVRRAGSDIGSGEPAIGAGTLLTPSRIGLLAALGLPEVQTRARPRVSVLSTGSELVPPGYPLEFGQIYESNGPMVAAAVNAAGARANHEHFVPDDTVAFISRMETVAAHTDLIITTGGVSAGAFEVVRESLEQTGDMEFVKVAMQPGMPQGVGTYAAGDGRAIPVICLPGNPVSALVSFEVFVRPPLRRLMGRLAARPEVTAVLTSDVRSPEAKRQYLRAVVVRDGDGGYIADPIGPPSSHHLRYLASANALIPVEVGVTGLRAGEPVTAVLVGDVDGPNPRSPHPLS